VSTIAISNPFRPKAILHKHKSSNPPSQCHGCLLPILSATERSIADRAGLPPRFHPLSLTPGPLVFPTVKSSYRALSIPIRVLDLQSATFDHSPNTMASLDPWFRSGETKRQAAVALGST
jgi:hypothetical protein